MTLLALWSLRALATILLGGLIVLALRRRSAAVRSLALRMTLVAAWLLPLAVLVAPRIEITVPKPVPVASPIPPFPTTVTPKLQTAPPSVAPVLEARPTATPDAVVAVAAPTFDPVSLVPFAYGLGVLGLLLRWLAGLIRLCRIAAKGERLTPHVIRVAEVGVPATFGLIRPAVLLPAASAHWPEARVQAAILHEEAHIRRRDWLWQTLANLFATIHWFNPAAWLLARALRDTAEAATDDEVLAGGFVPTAYARELLAVAAQARSAGPALAMARRGGVSDRVAAILLANRDRRRPTLPAAMTMTLLFLGVGLVVGSIAEARAAQSNDASSVSLPSGAKVTIDRVRDYGIKSGHAWKADGSLLPETVGDDFDYRPKSELLEQRSVALEVSVTGASNPSVILLAPKEAPLFQRLFSGNDRSRARFMFLWGVPVDESEQLVRLGIASGAWRPYAGPAVAYRLGKERGIVPAGVVSFVPDKHILADYKSSQMHSNPRTSIGFHVPRAMAGHEVRVNALDAQGRLLGKTTVSFGLPRPGRAYSASTVFYMGLKRELIAKLTFECREYQPVEFPTVAVRSRSAQIKPNEAIAIEAIGLGYPEGKAWRLDGTPDPTLKPPSDRMPTIVGWRRLQVAVRIKGRQLKNPWAQVTLWDKDLMPCRSDTCVLEDVPGSPNEKIAWCSLQVRPEFNVRTMGIDVANGDWRTDADVSPGKGAVLVERMMQPRDPSWRFYYVRFPGRELPGSDRDASLEVFGGTNQESTTFMNQVPLHPNGPYDFIINGAGKIKRLVLRSRASQHARAGKVSLWPSDTTKARLADGRTVDLLEFARYGKSPATWSADGNSRVPMPNSFDQRSSIPQGIEAHLRTAGAPVRDNTLSFRISYPSSVTSTHAVSSSPPSFDGFENWFVQFDLPPQGVRTATLSAGIGVGRWEAVNRSVKFSRENYVYLVPNSPDVITISSEIPRPSADFQLRLVGVDKAGSSLGDWHQAGSFMRNGKLVMVASSEGRRAKLVSRVELQQRRIRWTDIPNVAVVPR
jgi:beta-lactamase regulating signal transducer with metallopeptidase domain